MGTVWEQEKKKNIDETIEKIDRPYFHVILFRHKS
jgi:hypothetical protein